MLPCIRDGVPFYVSLVSLDGAFENHFPGPAENKGALPFHTEAQGVRRNGFISHFKIRKLRPRGGPETGPGKTLSRSCLFCSNCGEIYITSNLPCEPFLSVQSGGTKYIHGFVHSSLLAISRTPHLLDRNSVPIKP